MIARSITIVAPIVNEWAAPLPIVVMIFLLISGLLTSYSFPNQNEFTPGEEQKEIVYDLNGRKALTQRNLDQKDNSEGNVTHLNLSQAFNNEEAGNSTDEVEQFVVAGAAGSEDGQGV